MKTDTMAIRVDTALLKQAILLAKGPEVMRFDTGLYRNHPYYHFANPVRMLTSERKWVDKDEYFYTTLALLLFFALVRSGFPRYLQDLTRLFFRTTLKQRQAKEQMLQAPLPSLLLNILFLLSGAFFLTLIFQYFNLGMQYGFWWLFLYCVAGIGAVYLVKFITLKICGWLFRLSDAIDAYIFIVFTTNKVLGMALLPFVILLAFTGGTVYEVALNLAFLLVGVMFCYRFFLSYMTIHRQVKVSFFHFFLYLCAFEIAPLLLINKLLFTVLR